MNSPTLYGQNTVSYGRQNGARRNYATLPGSTESYGERTQIHTFENHANLLAYLANWLLYTPENGFQGTIKCQCGPFLGFARFLCAYCLKKTAGTGSY